MLRGIQDPRLRVLLEVPLALCLAIWLCGAVPTIPAAEAGPGPSYPRPPLLLQLLGWAWSPGVPVAARAWGCPDCLYDPPPSIQVKIPRKEEEEGTSSSPRATYSSSLRRSSPRTISFRVRALGPFVCPLEDSPGPQHLPQHRGLGSDIRMTVWTEGGFGFSWGPKQRRLS